MNGDQTGISKEVNWKGNGTFIFCKLKELNEAFVHKIHNSETSKELFDVWEEARKNGFLSYRTDEKLFDKNIDEFRKLSLTEQKRIVLECLEVNELYVNYSEIEDKQHKISKEDITLNKKFYGDF